MSCEGRNDALDPVWRALSDPTRRDILDLLRERPRTTGELAECFPTSRFAVMKHLGVLVDAGLVLARRRGRERWNYLNAVPLRQAYERWVRPYEGRWASRLVQLKGRLEAPPDDGGAMKTEGKGELRAIDVELEIAIEAPRARVWRAIVDDIGRWWRRDFYVGADVKAFVLEPRPGGRVYEDWGEGAGALWYTVTTIEPEKRLELAGQIVPGHCGNAHATTALRIALEEAGGRTTVKVSDSAFGRIPDEMAGQTREGWLLLFRDGLKPYVERGEGATAGETRLAREGIEAR